MTHKALRPFEAWVRDDVRRVHPGQSSVALSDRRPDGLHDHGITHIDSFD
jgi:hypothetical protein